MAFDPGLAERIRALLAGRRGITERRMFGGIAFMLNGHMFVGLTDRTLMARVGAERHADALALPHVRPMDFTGRPMKGYVHVDAAGTADDEQLGAWLSACIGVVERLPAKAPKAPTATKALKAAKASAVPKAAKTSR